MPIGPARMPLMEHLGELRMRLVRIVAFLAVLVVIMYFASGTIGNFLLEPVREYMVDSDGNSVNLQFMGALEGFTVKFKIAFFAALVAGAPFILWQILAFFLPALKPNERKWFYPTFAAAVVLFIGGTIFCYFMILPPAFNWLLAQTADLGDILPSATQYIGIILKFEVGFGFAFELPLIVFYLVVFNIVPYKKLRQSWRTVYVVLLVISAMVTPDSSPITMAIMFAALVALYEVSLLVARIVLSRRIKKQQELGEYVGDEEDKHEDEGDDDKLPSYMSDGEQYLPSGKRVLLCT